MVYDCHGLLAAAIDPLNHSTTYTYDDASRLKTRTDRNGVVTRYTYDRDGRLVTAAADDAVSEYGYDGMGRLTRADRGSATVALGYNGSSYLVRQESSVGDQAPTTLDYQYDRTGSPISVADPVGRQTMTYEANGLLGRLVDRDGGQFGFGYDVADHLTSISRPNGVSDKLAWNTDGELASRVSVRGGTTLTSAEYAYDDTGRTVAKTDPSGLHRFGYDPQGNLASVDHRDGSGVPDEAYGYDLEGNRTSWNGNPVNAVSYDRSNRLLRDAATDYTYDAEGNLVKAVERSTGKATRYSWDSDGQLTSVAGPDGTARYVYDAFGRRVQTTAMDGTLRRQVYDGANVALEYDAAGGLVTAYTTSGAVNDVLEARDQSGRTYPVADGLGSVVARTDQAGQIQSQATYDSFGVTSSRESTAYGYTGHQYDADTGLTFARARYYNPSLGRFLSEDPEPATSLYTYVGNQPLDFVDPTGRSAAAEEGMLLGGAPARVSGGSTPSHREPRASSRSSPTSRPPVVAC